MLVADMNSPQTLRRGKLLFSTIAIDHPARASSSAAVDPAGPAPRMIASYRMLRAPADAAGYEAMREKSRRMLMKLSLAWLRPQRGKLAAAEARLDAQDRVVSGDVVAPDRPQQMTAEQRQRTASRLAGDEQRGQRRQSREQRREVRFCEVVQEQIGGDDIHNRKPTFAESDEQISLDRFGAPPDRIEPTAR